jgi:hypothetical protein
MFFQIVHPFNNVIEGGSFKEAVKNYVKFNDNLRANNLIIRDMQNNRHNVAIRRYFENNKRKVGIDVYPYTGINPAENIFLPPNSTVQPVTVVPAIRPISPLLLLSDSDSDSDNDNDIRLARLAPMVSGPNRSIIATDSNIFYKL